MSCVPCTPSKCTAKASQDVQGQRRIDTEEDGSIHTPPNTLVLVLLFLQRRSLVRVIVGLCLL